MNSYAEVLGDSCDGDKKNYTEVIVEEGKNISKLLNDLIGLIKLEDNSVDLNSEKFDILELIKINLRKYRLDLDEKKVGVILDSKGMEEVWVTGDKFRLSQVVNNFLSNAVSYVENGGKIRVNIYKKQERVLVEVINSGPKISGNHIDYIWEPFYKVDESRNRKYGGTGLGLAISKGILEKHGSEHGVVNLEDGVKFWFEVKIRGEQQST